MEDNREINAHHLDDPYFDYAEDGSEGGNWLFLFAHLVLLAATFLGWTYLKKPPTVTINGGSAVWHVAPNVLVDQRTNDITCVLGTAGRY